MSTPPRTRFFFFNDTPTTEIYTLSLHDALPISNGGAIAVWASSTLTTPAIASPSVGLLPENSSRNRSEEHTSELQSRFDLVCRLLLEKKKKKQNIAVSLSSHTFRITGTVRLDAT